MNDHMLTLMHVMEEMFRKNTGEHITAMKVMYNDDLKRILEENRFVINNKEDEAWVCGFLENLITNDERFKRMFYVDRSSKKTQEEFNFSIYRRNKYLNVSKDSELKRLIDHHPGGLEVNQELLCFTYKKVKDDLNRLYKENTFRKLEREKGEANYLIFPKLEEQDMGIFDNKYEDYNFHWYLEQCTKINAIEPEKNIFHNGKRTRQGKKGLADPNYSLDNYAEMKKEWELKNGKK